MKILVAHEDAGVRYFDASTLEAWTAASLLLLRERFDEGWYPRPDDESTQRDRDWYEQAQRVAYLMDTSTRSRRGGAEPRAWALLLARCEAEYERVELAEVQIPRLAEVAGG